MASPDISVRLTAEGIEEVVNALRKIELEGYRAGAGTAKGLSSMAAIGERVTRIFGEMATAAGVMYAASKVKEAVTDAIHAANAIGDLSQATGASAQTLSLFSLAAKETGTPIEILGQSIPKLAKAVDGLKNGDKPMTEAFKRMGLAAKDFQGLAFDESLKKVAVTMGGFGDSEAKAAVAMQLFGKGGAMLIPVLDQLAAEGLPNVEARAKKLGILFSDDMVRAADQATKAWADMSAKTQGSVNQLIIGAVPQLTEALDHLNKSAEIDGTSGWGSLGVFIGSTLNAAAKTISFVTLMVKGFFNEIVELATFAARTVTGLFGGEQKKYLSGLVSLPVGFNLGTIKKELAASAERSKERNAKLLDDLAALDGPPSASASGSAVKSGKKPSVGAKPDLANLHDVSKARQDAEMRGADDRLKIQKESNKLEEQTLKSAYERNLIDYAAYFAARRRLAEQDAAAEILILRNKARALSSAPKEEKDAERIKRQSEIASIQAQIQVRQTELQIQKNALTLEEQKAALVEKEKNAAVALKSLETDKAAIQDKVITGELMRFQATDQINQLEKERLPLLVKLGAEMAAQAELSKDDTAIQKAKEYNAELDKRAAKLSIETDEWGKLKKSMQDGAYTSSVNNLTNALMDVTNGTKSVITAFNDMTNAILQDIQRIVLNRIATNIVDAGFNAAFSSGGAPASEIGGYTPVAMTDYAGGVTAKSIQQGSRTPVIRSASFSSVSGVVPDKSAPMGGANNNVVINMQNNSSQPVAAKSGGTSFDGKQFIINVVLEDIATGGPLRGAMKAGSR